MARRDPLLEHLTALVARYPDATPHQLANRVAVATLHWVAVSVDSPTATTATVDRVRLASGLRRTAARLVDRKESS